MFIVKVVYEDNAAVTDFLVKGKSQNKFKFSNNRFDAKTFDSKKKAKKRAKAVKKNFTPSARFSAFRTVVEKT